MGRGRAKAKQRGLARELKYNTPETDFAQLQQELSAKSGKSTSKNAEIAEDPDTE